MSGVMRQAYGEYERMTGYVTRTEVKIYRCPRTGQLYRRTTEYINIGRPAPVRAARGDEQLEPVRGGDGRPSVQQRTQARYDIVITALRERAMTVPEIHEMTGLKLKWLREHVYKIPGVQVVGTGRNGANCYGLRDSIPD